VKYPPRVEGQQRNLFPPAPRKRTRSSMLYASQNRHAAAVVLSDVAKYGGQGAGLVEWARVVIVGARQAAQ
jgi:hypothetical protein